MEFICSKNDLMEIISNVSLASVVRSAMPILEGICLEVHENNTLTVLSFNLQMGIRKTIPVTASKPGAVVLKAALLTNIISKMPDGDLHFSVNEKLLVTIAAGEIEFTIPGMDAAGYPQLPAVATTSQFGIPHEILYNMLEQTLFAAPTVEQSGTNSGALFQIHDRILTIVTLDGYRLALRREPVLVDQEVKVKIPSKTLSDLMRILSKLPDQEDSAVAIAISDTHLLFSIDGYEIVSRLAEGEFIDYKKVIPSDSSTVLKVKVRDLQNSLNRASIVISEKTKSAIKCTVKNQSMNIYCDTPLGRINENISVDQTGADLRFGFNNRYMLDALKACDCDEIRITLKTPLSPIQFLPVEGDHFLFLVLPIRLKDDE
jgi:DNA polymerase-3 subunit beta